MEAVVPLRIGVLVSGGGRTLLNIQDRIVAGELAASIELVISSRADAPAVERARAARLPVEIVDRREHAAPEFSERITDSLRRARVQLVCLAGFLSFWHIPDDFQGRVINIHPALLPDFGGQGFYGERVHQAVIESGVRESGCTVHFADNIYDHGPIILQRRVPVFPDDTVESLQVRVFKQELAAYPEVIRMCSAGELTLPAKLD